MQDLYIIVHESEVKGEHDLGIALSIRAYRRILEIKQKYPYRNVDGDPTIIPNNLPPPNACRIHVCGSSRFVCIPQQIGSLQRAGYSPRLSLSASIG